MRGSSNNYVTKTNLSGYKAQVCRLVKSGYGSFIDISSLDSDDFLDLLEYEEISNIIQEHQLDQVRKK
jgi:hypothetical protein